jgi:hypothetical protein
MIMGFPTLQAGLGAGCRRRRRRRAAAGRRGLQAPGGGSAAGGAGLALRRRRAVRAGGQAAHGAAALPGHRARRQGAWARLLAQLGRLAACNSRAGANRAAAAERALLRDALPRLQAFFEAGWAWKQAGRPNMAFVMLNRWLIGCLGLCSV